MDVVSTARQTRAKQFQRQDQAQSLPNPRVRRHGLGLFGPGEPPPFPRYDFLVRDDGERTLNGYLRESNSMNQLDNRLDPVHATILHGRDMNGVRRIRNVPKPRVRSARRRPIRQTWRAARDQNRGKNGTAKSLHTAQSRRPRRRLASWRLNAYFADVAWACLWMTAIPIRSSRSLSVKDGQSTIGRRGTRRSLRRSCAARL